MIEVTFGPEDGRRLPCREGEERTEYGERASGLRLRVTRSDARSWAVVYWSAAAKASRRLKLGDASTMPVSKARAAARAALHAVEGEGRDPQAERAAAGQHEREERQRRAEARRLEAERRREATFGKLCRDYVEYRRTTPSGRANRPARPNTLANWGSLMRLYIEPALGKRRPATITAEDFLDVLETAVKRGGPTMGPRVREFLAAVWRWVETRPRGLGVTMPDRSPLIGLANVGAERERERALSPAEVWSFWAATEAEGREGAALRLSLLTAARVREAADLDVAEVDLDRATWNLPAVRAKGGRPRTIPLSPQAVALLRHAMASAPGPRVFGSCSRVDPCMDRIRARMGGEHWQARDLRRTAATLCARLGADPFVVALVLGHARPDERMPAVTGAYLRWNYADKVREALDRLGAWVEDTAARKSAPGDVVNIEARR